MTTKKPSSQANWWQNYVACNLEVVLRSKELRWCHNLCHNSLIWRVGVSGWVMGTLLQQLVPPTLLINESTFHSYCKEGPPHKLMHLPSCDESEGEGGSVSEWEWGWEWLSDWMRLCRVYWEKMRKRVIEGEVKALREVAGAKRDIREMS